ncbi:WD40 repeat-like protein [Hesseltinella vesiculosa]|uniref:WD40 repeat-like protein n=1 Tax=Hesseltinella vesiculosa TaxID=101127 RepID=A0A1X2GYB0_9FUNG|nr:WD40 repeat-like protein [Hesseltinella vesiculosa]
MKDALFTSATKRKRSTPSRSGGKAAGGKAAGGNTYKSMKRSNPKKTDDDIDDDDDNEPIGDMDLQDSEPESEEEMQETAAEKRVRLAKAYLNKIEQDLEDQFAGGFDAADLDRDLIAERLRHEEDEKAGKIHRRIADHFDVSCLKAEKIQSRKGHQLAVTAAVLTDDGQFIYSASKDGSIIKWDATTLDKLHVFPGGRKGAKEFTGHTDAIYCMAVTSDGQYLATGGKDKKINIWSAKEDKHWATFTQHRDAISGLAFRIGHHQLYSGSYDRTIKLWNAAEKGYIETLFGHQDHVTSLDTLARERCISTGGRDKTTRLWKIVEQSQLVYRGGVTTKDEQGKAKYIEGSLDCVSQIDESLFVTGGDSGTLSLWDINRKKPIFTINTAHGTERFVDSNGNTPDGQAIDTVRWITALACIKYSDVLVSGSWDGFVRFWKLAEDNKSLKPIAELAVDGVINSLQVKTIASSNRTFLVIGVGQELSRGRWLRLKKAKNGTRIIELIFAKHL